MRRRSSSAISISISISIALAVSFAACREPKTAPVAPVAEPPGGGGGGGGLSPATWDVVLVKRNDVLNVRAAADPSANIVATLQFDARGIRGTGAVANVGTARWFEVRTERADGWVNGAFLTESVERATFAADQRPKQRIEELARVLVARGDLRAVTGARGLWVHHYGTAVHYGPDELAVIAASTQKTKWNGAACGEACLEGTFAELIGAPLAATIAKVGRREAIDERLKGGNASADPPAELTNFHFVSVMDPGTEANGWIDWRSYALYFDHSAGDPRVVAIVPDAWSP